MTDGVYSTADGLGDAAGVVLGMGAGVAGGVLATGGAAAAAAEPSGAGPVVGLIVGTVIALNLRNPLPYHEAKGEWENLANLWADMSGPLKRQLSDIANSWEGDSADAFARFADSRVVEQINALADAAQSGASTCAQMFTILTLAVLSFIIGTVAVIVALLAANASGSAVPAVKWAIVGTWVAFIGGLLSALMPAIAGAWLAAGTADEGYRSLVKVFSESTKQMADGKRKLELVEATALPKNIDLGNPGGWEKKR